MVTYFQKANRRVRLNPETRERYATQINKLFKSYYGDLEQPKEDTTDILKELFPDYDNTNGKVNKIPSLYEQYKTYGAALERACYPSYDAILDIEGQDVRSNNLAGTYKAALVYDWYNIDLMSTLDKCKEDWVIKGEAAAYINWYEEITQVKRQTPVIEYGEDGLPVVRPVTVTQNIGTFSAVDVKRVDPHNLYFDKTYNGDWQSCPKIYRDYVPIEKIFADTSLSLTREEKKELNELVYGTTHEVQDIYQSQIDEDKKIIGNTVEVLEFEGDFVDPENFEVLRKIEATVVAGKYLAKFQESLKPKSSIVWACYMARPDTGRGQSPLRIPIILNQVQNMCADLTMRSWQLQTYPTFLAPKGALPTYVALEAGRTVEYDADIFQGQTPQRLDFSNGLRGFDFSDFFKRQMENATGINQYMQGALDGSVRTASEASYIHSGATMRMAAEAKAFSHGFLYKLVRLYALFKKVYDTQDRLVKLDNETFAQVNEEVRNGNYTFIIGGSQSSVEREAETNKLFQMLGLPVMQSLVQGLTPDQAGVMLEWILNRANFKAVKQVLDIIGITQQLKNVAKQNGIQEQNFNGFQTDMMNAMIDNAPYLINQMMQQRQGG